MTEPRFGAALPDELREPQKIKTLDPAPHLPFANLCEPPVPCMSLTEKVCYTVIALCMAVIIGATRYWS